MYNDQIGLIKLKEKRIIFAALYVLSIVISNVLVNYFGVVSIFGLSFPASVFFVGLTFTLRDFVQRYWGDMSSLFWILVASLITMSLNVKLAFASTLAFLVSEIIDWFVYKITKLPFYKRVIFSNLFSCPVDSFIFISLVFGFNIFNIIYFSLAKYVLSLFGLILILLVKKWDNRIVQEKYIS